MPTLPTTQISTSISRPIAPVDRALRDAVGAIVNSVTIIDGQAVAPRLPSGDLRTAIAARLVDVRRALLPLERSVVERERAARAVAAGLSGWLTRVADPAAKVSSYLVILGDLPCWIVEQVCHDVARGAVDGLDPDFPPSAARLHQLGEESVAKLRKEAVDLHTAGIVKLEPAPVSAEERKRVGLKIIAAGDELERRNSGLTDEALRVKFEIDAAELARQQARVRAEYQHLGLAPPSPLALSPTALRDIAEREKAKRGMMPRKESAE